MSDVKCPYGYKYGKETDEHIECDYCNKWEDCINNRVPETEDEECEINGVEK